MEIFFPTSIIKSHYSDKPWMTSSIKKLIAKRQKAYSSGDKNAWVFYRNKVKSTIALAKQNFYSDTIEHNWDCRKWWSFVNTLSGRSSKARPTIFLQTNDITYSGNTLANLLNTFSRRSTPIHVFLPRISMSYQLSPRNPIRYP